MTSTSRSLPKPFSSFLLTATILTVALLAFVPVVFGQAVKAIQINEVMADNEGYYTDGTGSSSNDWIELYNMSLTTIDLQGWYLTDDADDLTKWTFTNSVELIGGEYLMVIASGSSTGWLGGQVHADFKLKASGEYLALVRPDGETIEYEYSPTLPDMNANESYGIDSAGDLKIFDSPTPGEANNSGLEQVQPPLFSVETGFFTDQFTVSLTCETPNATIRYTTDFSLPSETEGEIYSGPIPITNTACIRAIAYKTPSSEYRPSWTDTRTYIFYESVLNQSQDSIGPEWADPQSGWGGNVDETFKYEVDPEVMGRYTTNELITALRSIPTLSLVTDLDNLFGSGGLYKSPYSHGEATERQCHAAWIETNGVCGWAHNVGLRIQGGLARQRAKKPFSIRFKTMYGVSKLKYDMFAWDPNAVEEYDMLVLRANSGGHDAVSQVKDEHARRLLMEMGRKQMHGNFAHLYINGVYWGLYNPVERAQDTFCENYFGGKASDWDCYNGDVAIDGTTFSVDQMYSQCDAGVSSNLAYQKIQGNWPDGTRNPAYPAIMDIPNYIDYLLVNFWMGTLDWSSYGRNYYDARLNTVDGDGFKWFIWDAESSLNPIDRTWQDEGPTYAYASLRSNQEFRVSFGDAAQKFMFNDGALMQQHTVPRLSNVAFQVEEAMIFEEARWGMTTVDAYKSHIMDKINNYLPTRCNAVVDDLRDAGLYPDTDAPEFSQHGGAFQGQLSLSIASGDTVYYTLDGSDPRAYGGAVAGTLYTGSPIALDRSAIVRTRAMTSTNAWSALVEATFTDTTAPTLLVSEVMYNARADAVPAGFSATDYEFIELYNGSTSTIGLAGLAFGDGVEFEFNRGDIASLAPGEHVVVVADYDAITNRYGTSGINIAGQYSGNLNDGGERLLLTDATGGTNILFTYNDNRGWPLAADGAGHSLVPTGHGLDGQNEGSLSYGGNWRASTYMDGSPGVANPAPIVDVVINEFAAHTDYTNAAEPDYDSNDWIELYNTKTTEVGLADWYLSDSASDLKKWAIPSTDTIAAEDWKVFDEVTGFHSPITNGFGLNKEGEQLFLSYLPGTDQDRVADCVSFEGQENGASWGRYPDGDAYWLTTALTAGTTNALASADVVISQFMYHPAPTVANPEDNTNDEYIVLYNTTDAPIQLWNEVGPWAIDGGVDYTFPSNTTIGAQDYLTVVSFDPTNTAAMAAFEAAYEQPNIMGPYVGTLPNDGGRISLVRPQADLNISWVTVDEVIYSSAAPWPDASTNGTALHRIEPRHSGNDPLNWTAQPPALDGYGSWELANGLTPPSRLNDDDGDGFTNEYEYFFGLDPNSGANVRQHSASAELDGGKLYPAITYTRRKDAGVTYTVEAAGDLVSWVTASMVQVSVIDNGADGTETVTLRYNVEYDLLPDDRLFLRVRATE